MSARAFVDTNALRLFQEQLRHRERRRESLRRDVQVGLEALARGEYDEYDVDDIQELASEIKARGREQGDEAVLLHGSALGDASHTLEATVR